MNIGEQFQTKKVQLLFLSAIAEIKTWNGSTEKRDDRRQN
jgi:hypothetical protein